MSWEPVVGLEVHVQLGTGRKLFCGDEAVFGAEPNTHVCPVCLGLPGALPTPDPEAVALAVRAALALGCTVHPTSVWERKNYFYPDLPKGYQITQLDRPLATGGRVELDLDGAPRTVGIRRLHMEEDAGKSLHDRVEGRTAVDLNRAGTPLVEIVTEPELGAADEAGAFLRELRRTLLHAGVSDCSMEEGSLRADANVSVRRAGSSGLGVKTEIKNVNSFSHIEKAIDLEWRRQARLLDEGKGVETQTLLWDERAEQLRPMRSKEESEDYRYFPDPDLPPLVVSTAVVDRARAELPEPPRARRGRLERELGLGSYEAEILTRTRELADYFDAVVRAGAPAEEAAKWIVGPVLALRAGGADVPGPMPVPAESLSGLISLVDRGTVSHTAAKTVLAELARGGGRPEEVVEALGLAQVRDTDRLEAWIGETLAAHPDEVARLEDGEERLLGFLVGRVMARSEGAADPREVNRLLRKRLRPG